MIRLKQYTSLQSYSNYVFNNCAAKSYRYTVQSLLSLVLVQY